MAENHKMTKMEYILDCLVDDDETKTQIIEYFDFNEISITTDELDLLLNDLLIEGLITINQQWKNEKNEFPYSLTDKGKTVWKNIK